MDVSTRVDYAVRIAVELAAASPSTVFTREALARAQGVPVRALDPVLAAMARGGIVQSRRGRDGGYQLAGSPGEITVADVMRAVDGPLMSVRGGRPEALGYAGPAAAVQQLWIALRANLRAVTEHVTIADLVSGELPDSVATLNTDPQARVTRPSQQG